LKEFRRYISGELYTPPSLQGTIMTPGWFGGVEWGGASFDPTSHVLYVNANDAPAINRVRPIFSPSNAAGLDPAQLGRRIYEATCMACHRVGREGVPPVIPSLLGVMERLKPDDVRTVLRQGRNSMPAFNQFRAPEVNALIEFLKSPVNLAGANDAATTTPTAERYASEGTRLFVDQDGYPGIAPPWGTLNAVHLGTGEVLWQVPLGEYPELVAKGIRNTGTLNFGGPVATAGGLIFIAATADEKIRAFEKHTGRVLWEHPLPAGGYAIPSVYMLQGKQYVVITAGGGGKNATKSADAIVAFALAAPEDEPAPVVAKAGTETDWIDLFDGKSLDGWAHLNGWHTYTVEEGAIVGRTMEGSPNSFLCSLQEFADFEFEVETTVDRVTNQGIQFRSRARPVTLRGPDGAARGGEQFKAGRVYGPQAEIRRYYPGQPTTGTLYGEALGTGWLSSKEKIENGHQHFHAEGWNKVRIVAQGPRLQTWVNGHPVEDIVREDVYKTHPSGFIALQIHGLNGREPGFKENNLKTNEPLIMKWRNLRIRPLPKEPGARVDTP
jgi:quinoprotein glucose dehydrogenase